MKATTLLLIAASIAVIALGDSVASAGVDLAKQVTIRRTAYGVPHILAENERALGFGFGYAQAEDHMSNIMERILAARGELAQHFGGERNVKSDFWNRQYRVYQRAVETYHLLDPDWRDLTEGFAMGLNYYIAQHRTELPDWVQPVRAHDVAAHGLTGVARFAFNRGRIVDRLVEKLENGEETAVAKLEDGEEMGSNVLAFSPSRTRSGNAILMGNPHQPWSPVATYYEAHLTIPGKLNFYGSTFVGRPVLTTGFNEYLGWSHTVNYPDLEEIYALDVDPRNADHYLFDGGSVPLQSEMATVKIRTKNGMREESRTFWYSPLGPVVHRTDQQVFVLRSVAYEEFRFYQQWLRLAQAEGFKEFRQALEIKAIPMFNIGYADRDGNIFFLWNGTIPILPHDSHDAVAVRARNSDDVWTQVHEIEELPQLLNPKGGYIMNSNSTPYLSNVQAPMNRSDFPEYFPNSRMSLRSQHAHVISNTDEKHSLEDVVRLKHSMRSHLADLVKNDLLRALIANGSHGALADAAELLMQWDNLVTAESRGSVLFEAWWAAYTKGQTPQSIYKAVWTVSNPMNTPRGLADPKRAVKAFGEALRAVEKKYGSWDVAWGEVHRLRFGELDLPVGGAGHDLGCFRIVLYQEADDGKRVANSGDSWYFAVEFTKAGPKAYTLVAYSQSEIEGTPHFSDQASLFAARQMKRVAFTENEIRAQLIRAYQPGE